jgi:hypothetical protein
MSWRRLTSRRRVLGAEHSLGVNSQGNGKSQRLGCCSAGFSLHMVRRDLLRVADDLQRPDADSFHLGDTDLKLAPLDCVGPAHLVADA